MTIENDKNNENNQLI